MSARSEKAKPKPAEAPDWTRGGSQIGIPMQASVTPDGKIHVFDGIDPVAITVHTPSGDIRFDWLVLKYMMDKFLPNAAVEALKEIQKNIHK
jgi:hypothetical protein